jgi:hypothetical protein
VALGSNLAGVARVAFEAQTGEFNADVARAEQIYRSATSGMSDAAIRLELAQERLRRSLAKGPTAFREQARAELEVRRAEQQLRAETESLTRSQDRLGRELDQTSRRAHSASGAFAALRSRVVLAAGAFIGDAGLVRGMRSALEAASDLEEEQNKIRQIYQDSADEVLAWSRTTISSHGLASESALRYAGTVGNILNASGLARAESARLSRQIVELAADMASFSNEDPSDMLDRLRSGLVGEAEPLRRFGVLLSETAVKQEAYRSGIARTGAELTEGQKVLARYQIIMRQTADAQGDYARTADGAANAERTLNELRKEWATIVGQALLPAYEDLLRKNRDWLGSAENQRQLQERVNAAVQTGEKVVRGLAAGLRIVRAAAEPVIDALGGIEKAAQIALIVGLAKKASIAGLAISAIRAASARTAAGVVADNALIARSYDGVAAAAGRAAAAAGGVGAVAVAGGTGGGRRGIPPILVGNPALITAAVIASTPSAGGAKEGDRRSFRRALLAGSYAQAYPRTTAVVQRAVSQGLDSLTASERAAYRIAWNATSERDLQAAEGALARAGSHASPDALDPNRPGTSADRGRGGGRAGGSAAGRGGAGSSRELADILLDIARAETTATISDDLRFRRELANRYRAEIRALEARKNLTAEQKEELRRLYGELAREEAAIASLIESEEKKAQDAREEAQRKREEAERKAAERLERLREAAARRAEERLKLFSQGKTGRHGWNRQGMRAAALAGVEDMRKAMQERVARRDDERTHTVAELRRMQIEFLQGLQGIMNQFGSNVRLDAGPLATHAHVQTELLRDQNRRLDMLTRSVQHPGSRYARTELAAAFGGVGGL